MALIKISSAADCPRWDAATSRRFARHALVPSLAALFFASNVQLAMSANVLTHRLTLPRE